MKRLLIFGILCLFVVSFGSYLGYAARPLATEDARVLKKGSLVLELGAEYLDDQALLFSKTKENRRAVRAPVLGFAMGMSEGVELQADWGLQHLQREGASNFYGVEDLKLWTKFKVRDEDERWPSLGARFGVKLPNASNEHGVGTDEMDFSSSLLLGRQVKDLRILANVGMAILSNPRQNSSQDDVVIYGAGFIYPIQEGLNLVAEIDGTAASRYNNDYTRLRAGFVSTQGSLSWDISASAGLTDEAEDWGIAFGITLRDFQDVFAKRTK